MNLFLMIFLAVAEVSGTVFWRTPFSCITNPRQLVPYTVMECEPIRAQDLRVFPGQGPISSKVRHLFSIYNLNFYHSRLLYYCFMKLLRALKVG
jgi:hypothetical protein